jgi:hypothetical protein
VNRSVILRVLTGAALVGIAVVHLGIAGNYRAVGKHPLALSDQFYVQAAVACVLAAALLVRPQPLVWLASVLFAAGSLAVLVYSRYLTLPTYGLPSGFRETWAAKGAESAAWLEGIALALSLVGTGLTYRRRSAQGQLAAEQP